MADKQRLTDAELLVSIQQSVDALQGKTVPTRLDVPLQQAVGKLPGPSTPTSPDTIPVQSDGAAGRSTAQDFAAQLASALPKALQGPRGPGDLELPVFSAKQTAPQAGASAAKDFVQHLTTESRNWSSQFAKDFYAALTTVLPKGMQGPQTGTATTPPPSVIIPASSTVTKATTAQPAAFNWSTDLGPDQPLPDLSGGKGGQKGGRFDRVRGGWQQIKSSAFADSELGMAGGMLSGIGEAAGALGGPVGAAASAVGKFAGGLVTAVDRLRKWGDHLHQMNMQFADFSGAMAAVKGRQDVRDVELNRTRGDRRAVAAETLATGQHTFKEFAAEWGDAFKITVDTVWGPIAQKLGEMGKDLNKMVGLTKFLADQAKLGNNLTAAGEWMTTVATEHWTEVYGRPPDWNEQSR